MRVMKSGSVVWPRSRRMWRHGVRVPGVDLSYWIALIVPVSPVRPPHLPPLLLLAMAVKQNANGEVGDGVVGCA